MRILADENVEAPVIRQLRVAGHDVLSVSEALPSIIDEEVLAWAYHEKRLLLTIDKDFGDLVFRHRQPHAGVLLCRMAEVPMTERTELLLRILIQHGDELTGSFGVLTGRLFRLTQTP